MKTTNLIHKEKYWEWSVSENPESCIKTFVFGRFEGVLKARILLKAFFLQPTGSLNILQNFFFPFAVRKCLRLLKFCISNLILSQIIFSNLTNIHKLTGKATCTLDFMKLETIQHQKALIIQTYQSRYSSWKPSSKARITYTFSKGEAIRVSLFLKMMISDDIFDKWWISQPKAQ